MTEPRIDLSDRGTFPELTVRTVHHPDSVLDEGDVVIAAVSASAMDGSWVRMEAHIHVRPGESPLAAANRAYQFAEDMVLLKAERAAERLRQARLRNLEGG